MNKVPNLGTIVQIICKHQFSFPQCIQNLLWFPNINFEFFWICFTFFTFYRWNIEILSIPMTNIDHWVTNLNLFEPHDFYMLLSIIKKKGQEFSINLHGNFHINAFATAIHAICNSTLGNFQFSHDWKVQSKSFLPYLPRFFKLANFSLSPTSAA